MIVLLPPVFYQALGAPQRTEALPVEQLVPQLAAGGFDAVLTQNRLSCVGAGDPTRQDYIIEPYFRECVNAGYLVIVARTRDTNNLIMLKLALSDSYLIVKKNGQQRQLLRADGPCWDQPSHTCGSLRFEVRGDFYDKTYYYEIE